MSVLTHDHSPHMLREDARTASVPEGQSHIAMLKRFFRCALTLALFTIVLAGIMAIRVVAWFPPFHH